MKVTLFCPTIDVTKIRDMVLFLALFCYQTSACEASPCKQGLTYADCGAKSAIESEKKMF